MSERFRFAHARVLVAIAAFSACLLATANTEINPFAKVGDSNVVVISSAEDPPDFGLGMRTP